MHLDGMRPGRLRSRQFPPIKSELFMKLECFPTNDRPPEIVPGRPQRNWMETFVYRHPYRCLPLTMANSTGWEILCPVSFTISWNGGMEAKDITFQSEYPYPGFEDFVKSHFTH